MSRFAIDVAVAVATPDGRFATETCVLPRAPLGIDDSPFDVAHGVLTRLTGIDGRLWLTLRQVCLVDDPGESKTLLYAVELPAPVPLRGVSAAWTGHDDLDAASRGLCALALLNTRCT